MKTLIKNGRIVTAIDDYRADILIKDERIAKPSNFCVVYFNSASQ